MTYETIEYSVDGTLATIRLNRPDRFNSFNDAMHREMHSALKAVQKNESVRCLVITGNGKAFCTGQDLNDRYTLVNSGEPINIGASLNKNYNLMVTMLTELDKPVICAVNGVAAGAGVSLALACDIVVAAASSRFNFAFAKVGLVPDSGCSWSLVQAVGLPRAKALALLGESLTAAEAVQAGLIWQSVEDSALSATVNDMANRLAANPAVGQGLTKKAVNAAATGLLAQQLALEAQLQTVAGRSEDYAEAVRSFVEKRIPDFTGK